MLDPTMIGGKIEWKYWAFVLHAICYIKNRRPHTALQGITPYEAWTGDKPDLQHLRVLGCRAWVRFPGKTRKMDVKGEPCQLLGYYGNSMYWVKNQSGRVFRAKDVVFDETIAGLPLALEDTPKGGQKRSSETQNLTTFPLPPTKSPRYSKATITPMRREQINDSITVQQSQPQDSETLEETESSSGSSQSTPNDSSEDDQSLQQPQPQPQMVKASKKAMELHPELQPRHSTRERQLPQRYRPYALENSIVDMVMNLSAIML